jgi:phosphatidate cytidylyltransferase
MAHKFSNLAPRVAVAVVAIPIILFITTKGGALFLLLVLGIALLALHEFFVMAKAKGADPQVMVGMIAVVFLHLSFFHEKIQNVLLPMFIGSGGISMLTKLQLFLTILLLSFVLVFIVELFRNAGSIFLNAGYTLFGIVYIGIFLSSLVGIRELFGAEFPYSLAVLHIGDVSPLDDAIYHATYSWGGLTIISILASIWMCDTAAYFGGLSMGKHKLFPRVSPNKSWEGAVWGFFAAIATMMVAQKYFLPYLQFHQAIVIGIIIGLFGQIGDLVESLLKRDAGVKDSSSLIPGHGGVLDRFDSLIFVSPILYLYIDFVILS